MWSNSKPSTGLVNVDDRKNNYMYNIIYVYIIYMEISNYKR